MESLFFIFLAGVVILMVLGAINPSRRRTGSQYDNNISNFSYLDSDITHHHAQNHSHHTHHHGPDNPHHTHHHGPDHTQHHGHFDHTPDFSHSHVDSGSCHTSDFGGGFDGGTHGG